MHDCAYAVITHQGSLVSKHKSMFLASPVRAVSVCLSCTGGSWKLAEKSILNGFPSDRTMMFLQLSENKGFTTYKVKNGADRELTNCDSTTISDCVLHGKRMRERKKEGIRLEVVRRCRDVAQCNLPKQQL